MKFAPLHVNIIKLHSAFSLLLCRQSAAEDLPRGVRPDNLVPWWHSQPVMWHHAVDLLPLKPPHAPQHLWHGQESQVRRLILASF